MLKNWLYISHWWKNSTIKEQRSLRRPFHRPFHLIDWSRRLRMRGEPTAAERARMRGPRPGPSRTRRRAGRWYRVACGSGSAALILRAAPISHQSAASVPPESVSPLAAPFAGSCGLSPVDLLYREASIVARATASQVAPEDQSRYVPRRPRPRRRATAVQLDASSSGAPCEASSSLSLSICLPSINVIRSRTGPIDSKDVQRIPANARQVRPRGHSRSASRRGASRSLLSRWLSRILQRPIGRHFALRAFGRALHFLSMKMKN